MNDPKHDAEQADETDAARAASAPPPLTAQNQAAYVETAIQIAIRQGQFDDLPGAGKPIEGLGTHHDPDWWIRRKIETENLSGLGPPALLLRAEDRGLDDELDGLSREEDVRAMLEDFNRRVVEARRQLMGGPPVVTRTRDVDVEVAAWRERRARHREQPAPEPARERRWKRRKRGERA